MNLKNVVVIHTPKDTQNQWQGQDLGAGAARWLTKGQLGIDGGAWVVMICWRRENVQEGAWSRPTVCFLFAIGLCAPECCRGSRGRVRLGLAGVALVDSFCRPFARKSVLAKPRKWYKSVSEYEGYLHIKGLR